MRRPSRPGVGLAAGLATVAVLIAVVVGLLTRDDTPGSSDAGGSDPAGSGRGALRGTSSVVTITGNAQGAISPGVMVPVNLSFENPKDRAVALDRVTVTVGRVEAPQADADHHCSAVDFDVQQLSAGVVLTLGGSTVDDLSGMGVPHEWWPTVGMLNRPVNQDGCKGASLTLEYEAHGVEVSE